MFGLEPGSSGVGRIQSVNCATTTYVMALSNAVHFSFEGCIEEADRISIHKHWSRRILSEAIQRSSISIRATRKQLLKG